MFGEYAQIATFLPSTRDLSTGAGDVTGSCLPQHLFPPPPTLPLSFGAGLGDREGEDLINRAEDFVMIAEFSEVEGPKPVLTIPKTVGIERANDLNSLSVKMMAVDHQTTSVGFSISEDTQVVFSDDEFGISAFVHHFVLYDNQARGFVRPYCMVFVTSDFRKIMMFYEDLSSQFKRSARLLKYGNRLLFVKDLEQHLEDLEHTKCYMLNQVGRLRLKNSDPEDDEQNKFRLNAESELYKGLQNIQQSTAEIKETLTVLKPLLHDRRLECRFRVLEERAFHSHNGDVTKEDNISLQENLLSENAHDSSQISEDKFGSLKESTISSVSLFRASASHTPLLVETKKAKRFNSPLRGLHQLCSWGAKEGLHKLRCIYEYFKKDTMILELEKNEARLMDPPVSMVIHGQCVTSNLLAGISVRGVSMCFSDASSSGSTVDRLRRWPSSTSNDTLESFKSADSYLSLQDEENISLASFYSNNSSPGMTTSNSGQDFISAPTSPLKENAILIQENKCLKPSFDLEDSGQIADAPMDLGFVEGHYSSMANVPSDAKHEEPHSFAGTLLAETLSEGEKVQMNVSKIHSNNCDSLPPDTQRNDPSNNENVKPVLEKIENVDFEDSVVHKCLLDRDVEIGDLCNKSFSEESHLSDNANTTLCPEIGCIHQDSENDSANQNAQFKVIETDVVTKQTVNISQNPVSSDSDSSKPDSSNPVSGQCLSHTEITPPCCGNLPENVVSCQPAVCFSHQSLNSEHFQDTHRQSKESKETDVSDTTKIGNDMTFDTGEVNAVMDRQKLEFVESFTSTADNVSQSGENCCQSERSAMPCSLISPCTPSSESCLWKPRNGTYTVGDAVNSLAFGRPGFGVSGVLATYNNLQPVLFSLMTGRTVLVVGPAQMEKQVTKVVTALSIFLADSKRKPHCIIDWMNRPLKITDLTRIRLAGICRSDKRSQETCISTAVRQYSTVMDVERRTITGPVYQGNLLNAVLQQKKIFKTDGEYVAFIHCWLMEIAAKAFIFYHSFCLGEAGGLTQSLSLEHHQDQYNCTVACLMNRLGIRDNDIQIIEYQAEKVKLSQIEPSIWMGVEKGSIVQPLFTTSCVCHTVRC